MKTNIIAYLLLAFLTGNIITSCSEEELSDVSIFDESLQSEPNELDKWIEKNYLYAYNIDFKYRMEDIESSLSNNQVPIDYQLAVQMARIIKHVWFEAYDEVGGINFTRQYAPKVIHLIGSRQWNPNGTVTLGYAEGGLKVTLVGGNWLEPDNIPFMNEMYFQTMHHEFSHILHQTKNYPVEYNQLSEGHYSPSGWNNRTNIAQYAPYGFVTAYGSSQPTEDIAEVTACYLTWSQEQWDALEAGTKTDVDGNPVSGGWEIIQQKITIMKNYMKESFGVDMDQLRDAINRRCEEIQHMDLNELPE